VDGRNIWRSDLARSLSTLSRVQAVLGERLWIAPSCSLQHCPVDLELETRLDEEIKSWLAFSIQKLHEVSALGRGLNHGEDAISDILVASGEASRARAQSARIHNPVVQERLQGLTQKESERARPFPARQARQRQRFKLPLLPTTTIGSFPQTPEIRQARAAFKKSELGNLQYLEAMRDEIALAIRKQEEIGLDVLVHGEAERNDMVEYFGEQLWGCIYRKRVGAELWFALRKTAHSLRRHLSPGADDCRLDSICAKSDIQAGERHVDRSGNDADVVLRA